MKVTLAQTNPTIGDFEENFKRIETAIDHASRDKADLIVFPELTLSGYGPRDLLNNHDFLAKQTAALDAVCELSRQHPGTGILCGIVERTHQTVGKPLCNAAVLIENGSILFCQRKTLLPTYDIFDEARYFAPADSVVIFPFRGERLGITICEDAWNNPDLVPGCVYPKNPVADLMEQDATLLINLSAVPFVVGKDLLRYNLFRTWSQRYAVPFIHVNQAGSNDEIISGGVSMAFDAQGNLLAQLPAFSEATRTIDLADPPDPVNFMKSDDIAALHDALVLGIRDYMKKCGFQRVVLGLSGGIDSAVTCCLAAEAVGPENVLAVSMPSHISSEESVTDARVLADRLGVIFKVIPISEIYRATVGTLSEHFEGRKEDETEENIQARIRANILMALSNKFGHLTLCPGNKSELAAGYCTLYGDMVGGLAPLGDVLKTQVYALAEDINREKDKIPRRIIDKAPSAELKQGQTDQDMLPPYDVLDAILHALLIEGKSQEELVGQFGDAETVQWILDTLAKSEYKRKQAAPCLKVSSKAFGSGRRMPVAAQWPSGG